MTTSKLLAVALSAAAVFGAAHTASASDGSKVSGVFRLNGLYTDGGIKLQGVTTAAGGFSGGYASLSKEVVPEIEIGAIFNGKHEISLSGDIAKFTASTLGTYATHAYAADNAFSQKQTNVLGHYRFHFVGESRVSGYIGAAVGLSSNRTTVGDYGFTTTAPYITKLGELSTSNTSLTYGADAGLSIALGKGWAIDTGVRYLFRDQKDSKAFIGSPTETLYSKTGWVGSIGVTAGISYKF